MNIRAQILSKLSHFFSLSLLPLVSPLKEALRSPRDTKKIGKANWNIPASSFFAIDWTTQGCRGVLGSKLKDSSIYMDACWALWEVSYLWYNFGLFHEDCNDISPNNSFHIWERQRNKATNFIQLWITCLNFNSSKIQRKKDIQTPSDVMYLV